VLWIGGDVVGLPFIGVVFARMTREDHQRAAVIDAELDELEAARPTAPDSDPGDAAQRPRLWWEDDPELSQRFRQR
jgi:hypothetical protein